MAADATAHDALPALPAFPALLRALREVRGLTREGFAARLGYSGKTVQRWEQGQLVPDAAAEAALLALLAGEGLFRAYNSGPLAGLALTPELVREALAAARLAAHPRGNAPAPIEVPASPGRLPAPLTSFIGREAELDEIGTLLERHRLLTLTGAGGTGKTRLAVAGAERAAPAFPDGVWFVDLSAVTEPAAVIPTIAQVLRVQETEGRTLVASLAAYLRSKRLLLVLDNLEQVVGAAPRLADLLVEAPALCLLVTSRVRLQVGGEQLYAVPAAPLDVLGRNPAVQLFVERTRALRPDFALTAENAPVIAAICTRLDGLPLAIELAAARMRSLTAPALLARLEQRLPLLTGGDRAGPARQQTLRATIHWSWQLLDEAERALFRRLAVFAGGWTLEAAETVGANDQSAIGAVIAQRNRRRLPTQQPVAAQPRSTAPRAPSDAVLDGLASLVDKSLMQETEVEGQPRFSLLATLREFALEQLEAGGEAEAVRRRHAEYYCDLAERIDASIWDDYCVEFGGGPRARRMIDRERDNLLASLQWALDQNEAEIGLRTFGALDWWFRQRAPGEGLRWADSLLGLPDAARHDHARAVALWSWGLTAGQQGDILTARKRMEAAAALFRAVEDLPRLGKTLLFLPYYLPEADDARLVADEALSLLRATGGRCDVAMAEMVYGNVLAVRGIDLVKAEAHIEDGLRRARAPDIDYLIMCALGWLAGLAYLDKQYERVRQLRAEVLPVAEAVSDRQLMAWFYIYPALAANAIGDLESALADWHAGLRYARDTGSEWYIATCIAGMAQTLTLLCRSALSARLLAAIEAIWHRVGMTIIVFGFNDLFEQASQTTKEALDEAAFAAAWAEGQALSIDQAVAEALRASEAAIAD